MSAIPVIAGGAAVDCKPSVIMGGAEVPIYDAYVIEGGVAKKIYARDMLANQLYYQKLQSSDLHGEDQILENTCYTDSAGLHMHFLVQAEDPTGAAGKIGWQAIYSFPIPQAAIFQGGGSYVRIDPSIAVTFSLAPNNTRNNYVPGISYTMQLGCKCTQGAYWDGWNYLNLLQDVIAGIPEKTFTDIPNGVSSKTYYFGDQQLTSASSTISTSENKLYLESLFSFYTATGYSGPIYCDLLFPNDALQVLINNEWIPITFN